MRKKNRAYKIQVCGKRFAGILSKPHELISNGVCRLIKEQSIGYEKANILIELATKSIIENEGSSTSIDKYKAIKSNTKKINNFIIKHPEAFKYLPHSIQIKEVSDDCEIKSKRIYQIRDMIKNLAELTNVTYSECLQHFIKETKPDEQKNGYCSRLRNKGNKIKSLKA